MDQLYRCPFCECEFELNSLRVHCAKKHKISAQALYVKLFLNGVTPTCECGCGEFTKFRGITHGFVRFKWGHFARTENATNFGTNPERFSRSLETRRKMFEDGSLEIWNKNLNKESDERVAAYGQKCSETIKSDPIKIQARSERLREHRLSGVVPTLTGSAHSQWKGGSSSIQALCRANIYNSWARPKMKQAGWKCCDCGRQDKLCVHHDKERFCEILQKAIVVLGEHNDDFDRKSAIAKWVSDYHENNDVSGIVLCESCHDIRHGK